MRHARSGDGGFTEAFASDLFPYVGASPTGLSITFTLTGSVANSPADPTTQTGMFASVAVLEPPNYRFTSFLGDLEFGSPAAVFKAVDKTTLRTTADTAGGTSTLTTTLTFSVQPGEQFYVWQRLAAWAAGDARSADLTLYVDEDAAITVDTGARFVPIGSEDLERILDRLAPDGGRLRVVGGEGRADDGDHFCGGPLHVKSR